MLRTVGGRGEQFAGQFDRCVFRQSLDLGAEIKQERFVRIQLLLIQLLAAHLVAQLERTTLLVQNVAARSPLTA